MATAILIQASKSGHTVNPLQGQVRQALPEITIPVVTIDGARVAMGDDELVRNDSRG